MISARRFLLSGVVFALIFLAFPEIDLWASGQFFQPGERFALLGIALFDGIHRHLEVPLWFFLAFSLIYLITAGWSWSPAWLGDKRKQVAYILLTLVIGPGLLVNTVFMLLGAPQLVAVAALPAGLMFSTVFYASLYFTFTDCFEQRASADSPADAMPLP